MEFIINSQDDVEELKKNMKRELAPKMNFKS